MNALRSIAELLLRIVISMGRGIRRMVYWATGCERRVPVAVAGCFVAGLAFIGTMVVFVVVDRFFFLGALCSMVGVSHMIPTSVRRARVAAELVDDGSALSSSAIPVEVTRVIVNAVMSMTLVPILLMNYAYTMVAQAMVGPEALSFFGGSSHFGIVVMACSAMISAAFDGVILDANPMTGSTLPGFVRSLLPAPRLGTLS